MVIFARYLRARSSDPATFCGLAVSKHYDRVQWRHKAACVYSGSFLALNPLQTPVSDKDETQ
jgi:hypothetical protein